MRIVGWRRGFWLADVGAVVVVFVVLLILAIAMSRSSSGRAGQVRCSSNLRQIGQAMLMYANDHRGYPRGPYVPDAPPVAFTGWNAADPFGPGGPTANDVTVGAYLLVRGGYLSA